MPGTVDLYRVWECARGTLDDHSRSRQKVTTGSPKFDVIMSVTESDKPEL